MELSTRGRYAVMAMVELGCSDPNDGSRSLSQIAEKQHISVAYLEQLFLKLRRGGLVESARGRSGGYRLSRPADEISIYDVMAAVSEGTDMTRCGQGQGSPCIAGQRCRTHDLWQALGQHIDDFLRGVSLQSVIDGQFGAGLPIVFPDARDRAYSLDRGRK